MSLILNKILLADCMDVMAEMPDDYIDLAVVDPPYGIGRDGGETGKNWKLYDKKKWDENPPDDNYFNELFRVSKNQVVFGANYFVKFLKPSMGWIIWDKGQKLTMSDGELVYTSFQRALRIKVMNRCKIYQNDVLIHPTQKPVTLYRWILQNYAKPGQLIFDSHSGSGSLACACHLEKFDFIACEKDPDYHRDSVKRFNELKSQGVLF